MPLAINEWPENVFCNVQSRIVREKGRERDIKNVREMVYNSHILHVVTSSIQLIYTIHNWYRKQMPQIHKESVCIENTHTQIVVYVNVQTEKHCIDFMHISYTSSYMHMH